MLTNEEVLTTIENAFVPLRTVAEVWDYNAKVRFRVFDQSKGAIVSMSHLVLSKVSEKENLNSILAQVRAHLCSKGHLQA